MPPNYVNPNAPNPQTGMYAPPVQNRNVNLANTPAFNLNSPQATDTGQGGSQTFSLAITDLLKRFQGLGTKPFVKQGLDAQQSQNDRILAPTPQNLAGADPGLQNSTRNAYANALDPTIQGAQNSAQTFGEQLRSFGSAVDSAKSFMTDYQNQQDKAQDNARNVIHEILTTTDPTSLHDLSPDEINTLEKTAGYPKGFLSSAVTYKQKQDALAARKALSGGSTNINSDNERALLSQFNGLPIVKDYNTILSKKLTVDSILQSGVGGPGDLSVVYEFMKALDPTSVVRETEYAAAAKSGNIFSGVYARFNGYLKEQGGFLPPQVKSAFQSIIASKLKVQQQLYDNTKKQYEGLATRQGLNPQNVVIDYAAANTQSAPTGGSSSFSDIQQYITIEGDKAYIPRNVWTSLGPRMDALLKEAQADGYQLLVK